MSIKVVLSSLPYYNHVYTPPIQLAYLKAYLEQDEDIQVKIIDSEVIFFRSSVIKSNAQLYLEKIWSGEQEVNSQSKAILDDIVNAILSEDPDVVGLSVINANYIFSNYVSNKIKELRPDIFIIYGGLRYCMRDPWEHYILDIHREIPHVDCIVKGEGELPLMEVLKALKKRKNPAGCKGTTIRNGSDIIDGGKSRLIENIDSIPFPDFTDFSRQDYLSDYIRILFSRGCPGRCTYCTENYNMGSLRCRSPKNILEEIKLRISHGYRRFQPCDLAVGSNILYLKEVCQRIIDEKLDVEFTFSQFRHSPDLSVEVFSLLRRAGFITISFGTESASQAILNKMSKGVRVKTIEKNLRDAHKEGLNVVIFLMVGFPGETEETFMETVNFIKANAMYINAVQHVAPVHVNFGSRIHDNIEKYKLDNLTLFKDPDIWQSIDAKNMPEWRYMLRERMQKHLNQLGVSDIIFLEDGNPKITRLPVKITDINPEVGRLRRHPMVLYSSKVEIINVINYNYGSKYILRIKNTGQVKWESIVQENRLKNKDWIRAGCRVYEKKDKGRTVLELRRDLPRDIKPGESVVVIFNMDRKYYEEKDKYVVNFDIINEHKFWFRENIEKESNEVKG